MTASQERMAKVVKHAHKDGKELKQIVLICVFIVK
jgi:anti-sigma regulatory factor (Ser/Thr protein kinase)